MLKFLGRIEAIVNTVSVICNIFTTICHNMRDRLMELLSTKIKLVLLLIACCSLLMAAYWAYIKQKKPSLKAVESLFTVPTEKITKRILPNGMHAIIYQNDALPKVLVQMAYDVGSYVEQSGERGLAHLVEHMIFKGTEKLSETDIDTIARKYGATYNAFTMLDATSYYFESNKNNWKPFLEILADCMNNVRFDPQHLASEVKAVVQELKMNKDDYWKMMYLKSLELAFPPNHPYHMPTIGFKEDLLTLTADQVKAFYKKYYRPDRATLFIVGDVDPKEAFAEVERLFDAPAPTTKAAVVEFPSLHTELAVNNTRFYEDIKNEQLMLYWVIPGLKDKHEQAISVLEAILGAGHAGRLYRTLVDEHKVASSVGASAFKMMEAGLFFVFLEPLPGKKEACIRLIKEELASLVRNGVSDVDLARVAKTKKVDFFEETLHFNNLVMDWLQSYFATRDEFALFNRVNRYNDITTQELQEIAKTYLDPFLMNQLEVLPLPEDKKEMRQLMKEQSNALDQKILARHERIAPIEEPRAAAAFPPPMPLTFTFPQPTKTIILPNGLTVLLARQKQLPMISTMFSFKEAAFFASAREGVVLGLMMNMLLEGTKGSSKKETVDFFEQRGASFNFNAAGASLSCLSADFTDLLERFVQVLCYPTFAKDALEKLKKIELDALHRSKDDAKDIAGRLLKNALFKGQPFAWTFDEAIEDVARVNTASLKALHNQVLTAENLVVSIVGDFDVNQMEHVVRCYLGKLETGMKISVESIKAQEAKSEHIDVAMTRDQVVVMYGRPSPVTIYDADFVPLKLLNYICFKSLGSRIYKIRERTGLFYVAFGEFAARAGKQPGYDCVGAIINPENVALAETEILKCIAEIAEKGVTAEELDAAKHSYEKDLADLMGSNSIIAGTICRIKALELPADHYDKVLQRVHSLTLQEINQVAARYVSSDNFTRVRVGRV